MVTIAPGETFKNNFKTLEGATQSPLVPKLTSIDERETNIQHLLKKPNWFTAAEIFSSPILGQAAASQFKLVILTHGSAVYLDLQQKLIAA